MKQLRLLNFYQSLQFCSIQKRFSSKSSIPVKPMGSKRLKTPFSSSQQPISNHVIVKENDVDSYSIEVEMLRNDPSIVDTMTVPQLRNTLKSIGVPAKGRKEDLLSALKTFMVPFLCSAEQDSQIKDEQGLFISYENKSSEMKAKKVSGEEPVDDVNDTLETVELNQGKKRFKQSEPGRKIVKATTKKKLLVKSDEVSDVKPSRAKRKVSSDVVSIVAQSDEISTTTTIQTETWAVLAHKKPQKDWIAYNPRTMRPLPLSRDTKFVKLLSWNVNGLRALLKLEGFSALQLAQREDFDVLCLQETKLQEKDIEEIKQRLLDGYENSFWTCSVSKLGYSGTAIISRIKPLSVRYGLGISDLDSEGRLVTVEFDTFYLITGYVPNSGDGLKRLSYRVTEWDPALSNYLKELEKSKPVVLTGDLNCAHEEIDIYNPAGNKRSAGFTDEERKSFETNLLSKGFVDTFRRQHPGVVGYTYWGYRHGGRKFNRGWRLDYFLVSESIADKVHDSYILPDVFGSDHCPIGLVMKL
ncbi:unnamed protein product [Vicia faba]|uniref:DNA-(apurinic or apyrimidinic site) endonuclease n=1 Tax=Vicia faba TaxID=3906 RepID=A0AAV0ZZ21_VICFA|nr:unnamed protein product [Vicia faba]